MFLEVSGISATLGHPRPPSQSGSYAKTTAKSRLKFKKKQAIRFRTHLRGCVVDYTDGPSVDRSFSLKTALFAAIAVSAHGPFP